MRSLAMWTLLAAALLVLPAPAPGLEGHVHHELSVLLDVEKHEIQVFDRISLNNAVRPVKGGTYRFLLHSGLVPRSMNQDWSLDRVTDLVDESYLQLNTNYGTLPMDAPLRGWALVPSPGKGKPFISYSGKIHHPVKMSGGDYQRGFATTKGIIGEEGVFLSGASYWVPTFGDGLVTFDLWNAQLKKPWTIVSQGRRTVRQDEDLPEGVVETHWACEHPVEGIYLVAGPWKEYADRAGEVEIFAFLREAEPALANRYMEATKDYLAMYEEMITPYPWPSFALVENFWDTGYGMPGFTLLGPRVIRFPWILTSSYPHEILHNWWGNSVYVHYWGGNWCEGLTAYMADHLFAEQRGGGAVHRRATLQKYTDFVQEEKDFPLTRFRSRHSPASEAVGYGKSLMLFHMLRREVGDEAFLAALGRFHRGNLFQRASFQELAVAFTEETGRDWLPFFKVWTKRAGAPEIEIVSVEARAGDAGWSLDLVLRQAQEGEPFPLRVPVAVTLEGGGAAHMAEVEMEGREARLALSLPGRPVRIDVDPAFDCMRRLDPMEVPPALSMLFGEDDPLFVLPSKAPAGEMEAWKALAGRWAGKAEPRTALDSEIRALPEGTLWILGRDNRYRDEVTRPLKERLAGLEELSLGKGDVGLRVDRSLVLVARRPGDPRAAAGWVSADRVAAIPGLARKLPHYTRYSYLAFRGDEPDNTAKGMWEPEGSPLTRGLGEGPPPDLRLPARKPLAETPSRFEPTAMKETVEVLSSPDMEGRGLGTEGLERATLWVEERLGELGLEPAGNAVFRQTWTWTGGEPEREMELVNLLARRPGTEVSLRHHPVLVTAHLDHLGRGWPDVREGNDGKLHPGADDNASGVAVLLAVARVLAEGPSPKRPVLFAVVTGEEAGLLGSRRLVESLSPDHLPFACINLDTVGRLGEGKVLVLNADSAREWRHLFMGIQHATGTPVETVKEPLDSSDQVACLEAGVPAVQLFTGPHPDYHRPTDTADKVDAAGLAKVAGVALEAVSYLADREEPLTGGGQAAHAGHGEAGSPRRVSFGILPDFAFEGPGVRVQDVLPGSPAQAAGLRAGDLLVAFGGSPVADLRGYSNLLKAHAPGDKVEVSIDRNGENLTLSATLKPR